MMIQEARFAMTNDALKKKRRYTSQQERQNTTDTIAREIIASEKSATDAKTARLRDAREKQVVVAEQPAPAKPRKPRKPVARTSPDRTT